MFATDANYNWRRIYPNPPPLSAIATIRWTTCQVAPSCCFAAGFARGSFLPVLSIFFSPLLCPAAEKEAKGINRCVDAGRQSAAQFPTSSLWGDKTRCIFLPVPSPRPAAAPPCTRATPHWLRGRCALVSRIIKGQGIDIKSLSSRSVLTVTNMTEDRYGNYTCVASNKLGTANATVSLIRKLSLEPHSPPTPAKSAADWRAAEPWVLCVADDTELFSLRVLSVCVSKYSFFPVLLLPILSFPTYPLQE